MELLEIRTLLTASLGGGGDEGGTDGNNDPPPGDPIDGLFRMFDPISEAAEALDPDPPADPRPLPPELQFDPGRDPRDPVPISGDGTVGVRANEPASIYDEIHWIPGPDDPLWGGGGSA